MYNRFIKIIIIQNVYRVFFFIVVIGSFLFFTRKQYYRKYPVLNREFSSYVINNPLVSICITWRLMTTYSNTIYKSLVHKPSYVAYTNYASIPRVIWEIFCSLILCANMIKLIRDNVAKFCLQNILVSNGIVFVFVYCKDLFENVSVYSVNKISDKLNNICFKRNKYSSYTFTYLNLNRLLV